MSDFSLFSLFTAGLACLVPFTAAYTQPTGDAPSGNPILTPGLGDVVPVNQPYTITWEPTLTEGTVSIVLLKGPSENVIPQYAIAENIPVYLGRCEWTPSDHLAPGETGYGIQLIVDQTGEYQYSTQFGVSNPEYAGPYSGSAAPSASYPASKSYPAGGAYPTGHYPAPHNGSYAHPTGYGPHNGTHAHSTGKVTYHHGKPTHTLASSSVPATSYPSAPKASATGGASQLTGSVVGLVVAGGMAMFAL